MTYYHPNTPYSWPGFRWILDHPDRPYCWTYLEKQDGMTWEIPVNELPLNHPARPEFVPLSTQHYSSKVRCSACGATGHWGGRWMIAHLRGHAPCGKGCGTVLSVLQNLRPRSHARCPQ